MDREFQPSQEGDNKKPAKPENNLFPNAQQPLLESETNAYKMTEENEESASQENLAEKSQGRTRNLYAIVILLAGLFAGSLFVDVAQLVSGKGYSLRALSLANIFEAAGKTWVAYEEPIVEVKAITEEGCEECDPSEILVSLRRLMPTLKADKVEWQSEEGERLQKDFNINALPAFVFSENVSQTSFFSYAEPVFEKEDDRYLLNMTELGAAPGKFLQTPQVAGASIAAGAADAKVNVVVFSDFQCPYSKIFYDSFEKAVGEFSDRGVRFVYKHLPLNFHQQAKNASVASECAAEQGKFFEYARVLYDAQAEWNNTEGMDIFKPYAARARLNQGQFNQCVASGKYDEKVLADEKEAASFGVNGTPGTFVNGEFHGGAIPYETLKTSIEKQLGEQNS